jgi:hypothetical protein
LLDHFPYGDDCSPKIFACLRVHARYDFFRYGRWYSDGRVIGQVSGSIRDRIAIFLE